MAVEFIHYALVPLRVLNAAIFWISYHIRYEQMQ